MAYHQKNNPFKNTSFGRFTRSNQSDIAGTIGDEDITNREIGELRRTARSAQSFRERMAAKKKLRGFQKGTGKPTVEIPKGEGKQMTIPGAGEELHYQTGGGFEETNPNDLRPPVEEDILPKLPGHEKDPHSYRIDENGQYYYKLGDGDWKPAPKGGAWDKAIKKRYEKEMSEIVAEKSEQAGPTIESANQTSAETISTEDAIKTDWNTKIHPVSQTKKKTKGKGLRFPNLGKYDYRNAPSYRGTDSNYPLP